MSVGVEANVGTAPVREAHRFNEAALDRWMETHVEGYAGPLVVEQFNGGQSNPTYKLVTPARAYVLRRKPPGQLLKGAHAIEREFQVLTGLARAGFPVAAVHELCTDDSVVGTWFYVMEMVEGRIFWDALLPEVAAPDRRAVYSEMVRVLAALHSVDYAAVGLSDYGKPGHYVERQVTRWTQQYRASETEKLESMERLIEWLPKHIPADEQTSIVHGDFRLDNTIFHPEEPRILAVLDWELSTLGHPLVDFAYYCLRFHLPVAEFRGVGGVDAKSYSLPTEAESVEQYCRLRGIPPIPPQDWAYYSAFCMFRLAGILQGVLARALQGNASSATALQAGRRARPLAELGWKLVQQTFDV